MSMRLAVRIASLILIASLSYLSLAPHPALSADSPDGLWREVDERSLTAAAGRTIVPQQYRVVSLDLSALRDLLARAPMEGNAAPQTANLSLTVPMPGGSYARFSLEESPIMEAALAASFPELKTYRGQGLDDPAATIRFDLTPSGFHAMVLSGDGTVYIDPYSRGDITHYISYFKRDYTNRRDEAFRCLVELSATLPPASGFFAASGSTLRTYRLALATTGEYTAFHGGTVSLGLAAITTTMNRVNGIYEREVAVRMTLVANESSIIYTNSATDPYANNDGITMLGQNQSNLDAVIGSANYDIGHVFSTGGGGVASLGVVCKTSSKARGVTGRPSPIGDAFDVDYVAHEIGHQFGANHTFNGSTASCSGFNRHAATAYEPGSGSTIMAYAGICGAENLQLNSDDYFHGANFDEIVQYITNGSGNSCAVATNTGNTPPTVSAGSIYTIPRETPFTLTGTASDPDGDSLTYCWEEFDLGSAGPPNTDNGNRPIFRSFLPTTNPARTFPKLSSILGNTSTLGEALPITTRTMNFRVTARDNRTGGGGVDFASTQLNITSASGPFLVTQPNTEVTWTPDSSQTVTWSVAGTALAPVDCANVKISLSTDGGNTFPTILAASTPNDGSEAITVPDVNTSQARVKIEAVGNIFFDISNVNFVIGAPPTFTITMSQSTYVNGETITASEFRPKNPSTSPVAVRLRLWLVVPTVGEVVMADVGADGSFMFPGSLDTNVGPISLLQITSGFPPRGNWQFNSRITNPTTSALVSEDINPFVVQ